MQVVTWVLAMHFPVGSSIRSGAEIHVDRCDYGDSDCFLRAGDRAELAVGGKVVRPAQGTLTRPRGRPKKVGAKVHIHIRLSPTVLEAPDAAQQIFPDAEYIAAIRLQ